MNVEIKKILTQWSQTIGPPDVPMSSVSSPINEKNAISG